MLGAQGVWMGTRFVASPEWGGQTWKQQAVLSATSDDTVQTNVYDRLLERPFPEDIHDRVVRNAFNAQWQGNSVGAEPSDRELLEQLLRARERGDADIAGVSAGVSSGLIASMQPAADIVHAIVRDAEDLLRQRSRQFLVS
jgi:NAD(P)H-dependent flavin oxidoreductase YrpB (nitropropane dioxygenase family)